MADIQTLQVTAPKAPATIETTFRGGKAKRGVPYGFTVLVSPGDHTNETVQGSLSFTIPAILEVFSNGWIQTDGQFPGMILENELLEFRATFLDEGDVDMTFNISKDGQTMAEVTDSTIVEAPVAASCSIAVSPLETAGAVEVTVSVVANDDNGTDKNFKYSVAPVEAVKMLKQYVNGQWMIVDPSNLPSGELRTVKDEDIKFQIEFLENGDYAFGCSIGDAAETSAAFTVSSIPSNEPEEEPEPEEPEVPEVPVEPETPEVPGGDAEEEIVNSFGETLLEEFVRYVVCGHTESDTIDLYAFRKGVEPELADKLEFKDKIGDFAKAKGLVASEVEAMLLNRLNHAWWADAVKQVVMVDLLQDADMASEALKAIPEGFKAVASHIGGSVTITDPSGDLNKPGENIVITGGEVVTEKKTITGASVALKDFKQDSVTTTINAEKVVVSGMEVSGKLGKNTNHVQINASESIEIKDSVISGDGYNGLMIAFDTKTAAPKTITIDGVDFTGTMSNNTVNIFGMADDGVVTIKNCHFGPCSNPFRYCNQFNAKNVTINLVNCQFEKWEISQKWTGIVCLEDIVSKTIEERDANNFFAPEKVAFNFVNCIGPDGKKIAPADLSKVCGSCDENQLIYTWCGHASKEVPAYDPAVYPVITFA